jgi:hypothetical protein
MNALAEPNGIVLGEGLHEKVKDFAEYEFEEVKDSPLLIENGYRVYSIKTRG